TTVECPACAVVAVVVPTRSPTTANRATSIRFFIGTSYQRLWRVKHPRHSKSLTARPVAKGAARVRLPPRHPLQLVGRQRSACPLANRCDDAAVPMPWEQPTPPPDKPRSLLAALADAYRPTNQPPASPRRRFADALFA